MENYKSISQININKLNEVRLSQEIIDLLTLLEEVNPCDQEYEYLDGGLVISYRQKVNIFNFFGRFNLFLKLRIVGLPISICERGYYGNLASVKRIIEKKQGLSLILNGNKDLDLKNQTLSSFIFYNRFEGFDDYLKSLRSPYRRRISKALEKRNRLIIKKISNEDFNIDHYSLYKDLMARTKDPLETLSLAYFKAYDGEIYEFLDKKDKRVLAFIQVKEIQESLYFLFCGFKREEKLEYDLYFNMLIKVLELGFEKDFKIINFGQTSEESKSKLGCVEEYKYLAINYSNKFINLILQSLIGFLSYKPYTVKHMVFKEGEIE